MIPTKIIVLYLLRSSSKRSVIQSTIHQLIAGFSGKIKELAADCLHKIREFKEKILSELTRMEATIASFFYKKQLKLSEFMRLSQTDTQINQNMSFEGIVQQLNQQRKIYFEQKNTEELVKSDYFEKIVKNRMKIWNQSVKSISESFSKYIQVFQNTDGMYDYQFGLKLQSILICRLTIIPTRQTAAVNEKSLESYHWSIEILAISRAIGIGISREKVVFDNEFKYWKGWGQGKNSHIPKISDVPKNISAKVIPLQLLKVLINTPKLLLTNLSSLSTA